MCGLKHKIKLAFVRVTHTSQFPFLFRMHVHLKMIFIPQKYFKCHFAPPGVGLADIEIMHFIIATKNTAYTANIALEHLL